MNLKYDNKDRELCFNFRTIKNIFTLTQENPFDFLQKFIKAEDKSEVMLVILYCMLDAKVSLEEINTTILSDINIKTQILLELINLINLEINGEIIEETSSEDSLNNNNDKNTETTKIDMIKIFEGWWNYNYYIATIQLKMSQEDFYNSSLREIKTLDKLNFDYNKNVLLDTYLTVVKAQNNSNNSASINQKDSNKRKVSSLDDLF